MTPIHFAQLAEIAQALVAPGKGILAADESTSTIEKRFKSIGLTSTEDTRRAYRDMLFTAPGANEFISGVILFDETLRQKGLNGKSFVDILNAQGIIPGIKVDRGTVPLAFSPKETITEGLDGLRQRLQEYAQLGAKFAKWRAVITIDGEALPTDNAIEVNAHALARYAALCQEVGLVPIVEPEVLMDGKHTIDDCFAVTSYALECVFKELRSQGVALEAMLLKPNMVISGKECPEQADVDEVAAATLDCFRNHVPAAVAGIVFLSGGQSDELATAHLNAMNASGQLPWPLSFSYGRALQAPALKAWGGKPEHVKAGQQAFLLRAKLNSLATEGAYEPSMEMKKAS
jgi:fructose-bisphosphate aldolase class I